MSSIDPKQRDLLVAFYEKHVLALAAHPETALLPGPNKDAESFFHVRTHTRLEPADFDLGIETPVQVAHALEQKWAGTPLAGIGDELLALVEHFDRIEEKAEVSSFIYEMF